MLYATLMLFAIMFVFCLIVFVLFGLICVVLGFVRVFCGVCGFW